jgi:hypothetical protein
MNCESLVRNEQNIRMKSYYELFICRVLVNHVINSNSLLRTEQNIWIQAWYELYINLVVSDHIMNTKYLLLNEQTIWMQSLYQLFICRVPPILQSITNFCSWMSKIFEQNHCMNYSSTMCCSIRLSTWYVSSEVSWIFEYHPVTNHSFVLCSSIM